MTGGTDKRWIIKITFPHQESSRGSTRQFRNSRMDRRQRPEARGRYHFPLPVPKFGICATPPLRKICRDNGNIVASLRQCIGLLYETGVHGKMTRCDKADSAPHLILVPRSTYGHAKSYMRSTEQHESINLSSTGRNAKQFT
jgi:hypothetical protein